MKIREAVEKGIKGVRDPKWANPNAYILLPVLSTGGYGPWAKLYDEAGQIACGLPVGSQTIFMGQLMEDECEEYTGPVHASEPPSHLASKEAGKV